MVEHINIIDAQRHEAKGASTASNGQVLKANGDGSTSFVAPNTLANISVASTLEAQSISTQNPTGTDTPLQVVWGSGGSNADVDVASNGTITILTAGLYLVEYNLAFGRATAASTATLVTRRLINDVASGFTDVVQLSEEALIIPFSATFLRSFSANDTIKVEFLRDSGDDDVGGLVSINPVLAGWDTTPSASVRIQRIAGGS